MSPVSRAQHCAQLCTIVWPQYPSLSSNLGIFNRPKSGILMVEEEEDTEVATETSTIRDRDNFVAKIQPASSCLLFACIILYD